MALAHRSSPGAGLRLVSPASRVKRIRPEVAGGVAIERGRVMDDKSYTIRLPKRWARIAMIVGVTALIVAPLTAVATHSFSDVPESNTFHSDIAWLKDAGVTLGCNPPTNNLYCPDDNVTRAQMSAFMRRLAENQVVDAATAVTAESAQTAALAEGLTENEPFREVGTPGEPSFEGTWGNFGLGRTSVGFFKDHQNIVHLKGSLDGGNGGVAFTLPAEYRPNATLLAPAGSGNNTSAQVTIASNGAVTVFCAGGTCGSVGLDGISFRVGVGGAVVPPAPSGETPDG
jgi:hypothetical protein